MFYGKRTVKEMDDYYGINKDENLDWMVEDCRKIQDSFNKYNVHLTMAECRDIYETWSEVVYSASWEGGLEYSTEETIFKLLMPWLKKIIHDRLVRAETILEELSENGFFKEVNNE